MVGMPKGRILPLAFGMNTRRTGERDVVLQAQTVLEQMLPVLVGDTYDSVDAGSFPTAVLLADLADGQELRGPR